MRVPAWPRNLRVIHAAVSGEVAKSEAEGRYPEAGDIFSALAREIGGRNCYIPGVRHFRSAEMMLKSKTESDYIDEASESDSCPGMIAKILAEPASVQAVRS
jgi:hypothetical protein